MEEKNIKIPPGVGIITSAWLFIEFAEYLLLDMFTTVSGKMPGLELETSLFSEVTNESEVLLLTPSSSSDVISTMYGVTCEKNKTLNVIFNTITRVILGY